MHHGDYNADPHALSNLADLAVQVAKLDVVTRDRPLQPTDQALFDYPVVFLMGHFGFQMPPADVEALAKYLRRGGFLLAEACCGRKAFDAAFRDLARQLLDGKDLTPLPADHAVYGGQGGYQLGDDGPAAGCWPRSWAGLRWSAPLEAGTLDGRQAILYSPLDWSCGLENDKPYACRGYVDQDARKLGVNLLLYAISF